MASRRQRIPQKTQDALLFTNNHTCCICRAPNKDVQIHHIDGKASNNESGNLVVLCLDCHSRVTGARGLGKRYAAGEVRRFKRSWEQQVLTTRAGPRQVIRYRGELLSQVDLIICETLARETTPDRARERLDVLYNLHLWRGNKQLDAKIIEGFEHLAVMTGLSGTSMAASVAEKLWEMCQQFVGPHEVPMDKDDLRTVLKCVRALGTLATFNCEFGHGRKAILVVATQAENFFEVGLWYSRKRIVNQVLGLLEESIAGCYEKGVLEFPYGRTTLRKSVRRLQRLLSEWRPSWRQQSKRLAKSLSV